MTDVSDSKIVDLKDGLKASLLDTLREKYKKITLAGGCFDILHFGHIQFLKAAKAEGGALVILLESDEALSRRKKRKPIHTLLQRAHLLAALSYVDTVIMLPELKTDEEYRQLTEALKPMVIAITDGDPQQHQKEQQAERVGGTVKVVTKRVGNLSTSSITNHAATTGNKSS